METENTKAKIEDGVLYVKRSLKKPEDGHTICQRLIEENRERNIKNTEIWRQYNGAQPFSQKELTASGQSWRSNRSTGFMSNIVQRSFPPYLAVWEGGRYITNSKLVDASPEAEQKNSIFQEEFTKLIRRWSGWKDLAYLTVSEEVLLGYSACCLPDISDWKPIFLRGDQVFFPDNCPQDSSIVPLFVIRHDYYIHELAEKIEDPEMATAVGWEVDNVLNAINNAQPKNRQDSTSEGMREYQDMVREMSIGMSFQQGVDVIETSQLFIREPDGTISHFIYNYKNHKVLYSSYSKFESMEECLALFSVEIGNGKIHGSKGAGRILYNTHVVAEQARNKIQDNFDLAGMITLKKKGDTDEPPIKVMHPMAIIDSNYEVSSTGFQVNTDAFMSLDRHLSSIAEMQVGVFMPAQMLNEEGGSRSAAEVKYVASIEQQIRDGLLARHAAQFFKLIHMIQRRVFSMENIIDAKMIFDRESETGIISLNPKMNQFRNMLGLQEGRFPSGVDPIRMNNQEAIECSLAMFRQGLTAIDIFELGECDPSLVTDDSSSNPQVIDSIRSVYMGHPNVRQTELITRDISSKVGYNVAQQLIIPEEDNTITSESTRLQIIELQTLMTGEGLPTSPRDNDKIHMNVIIQKSKPVMDSLRQGGATEDTLMVLGNVLKHFEDHVSGARAKGMQDTQLESEMQFLQAGQEMLKQALTAVKGTPNPEMVQGAQPAIQGQPPMEMQ